MTRTIAVSEMMGQLYNFGNHNAQLTVREAFKSRCLALCDYVANC